MRVADCIVRLSIICALAALCTQAYAGSVETSPTTSGNAEVNNQSGTASFSCEDCPPFVAVPSPPSGMRRITHAAVYELTWSQYLRAVKDGSCKFPLTKPDGSPLSAEERHQFDLNWTAGMLRLSDVVCFKSWIQRRLPAGYIADIPTGTEWIWLAKAGASEPKISAQAAVLLESEAILGSYGLLPKPRVPATNPKAGLYCGLVGRMPPNAWGLFDVIGNEPEITSGIKSLGNGRFAPIHIVELRGGGCLTPVAKVPIHIASNGAVRFDDDSVIPSYAVRLVVIQKN